MFLLILERERAAQWAALNLQLRHVPSLGIESETSWCIGRHFTNQATLAMGLFITVDLSLDHLAWVLFASFVHCKIPPLYPVLHSAMKVTVCSLYLRRGKFCSPWNFSEINWSFSPFIQLIYITIDLQIFTVYLGK